MIFVLIRKLLLILLTHVFTLVASKLVEKMLASVYKFGKYFVTTFYANLGVILNNYSFSLVYEIQVLNT